MAMRRQGWIRPALAFGLSALGVGVAASTGVSVADEPRAGSRAAHEEALVELGRRLFFDPRLSRVGARSCASCHDPEHGYSDPALVSDDELGTTRRHSQTLLDAWRNPSAHWDGEFPSVEHLVLARIGAVPGGSHGGRSDLLTAAERRERVRQGRQPSSVPVGSGAARGTPAPDRSAAGSQAAPSEADRAGDRAGSSAAEPADGAALPASGSGAPAAAAEDADGDEKVVPIPRDNPAYTGRFANPTGSVGNNLRKPKDAPDGAEAPPPGTPPPGTPPPATPSPASPAEPGAGAAEPEAGTQPAPEPAKEGDEVAGDPQAPSAPQAAPAPPQEPVPESSAEDVETARRVNEQRLERLVSQLVPVARELERNGRYAEAFQAAFGSTSVNDRRIAEALGAYVRSIRSTPSAFDAFEAGHATALSPLALQGLALFKGRAGCVQCHPLEAPAGEPGPAPLSDYAFHNTGIAWRGLEAHVAADRAAAERAADAGRAGVSTRPADRRAFKTPTLRDVAKRAPYMHDGSLRSLEEVVRHYARGGGGDPEQDARLRPFAATEQEIAALVAYLESLSGAGTPGSAAGPWTARAQETTLTFVDAHGQPLADVEVGLVPVGDVLPARGSAAARRTLLTDAKGRITYSAPADRTHVQIVLEGAFGSLSASWVPDTCRSAEIAVPVLGRARLVLTLAEGVEAPSQLVIEHEGVASVPGQPAPRTTLERVGLMASAGGNAMLYAGWVRDDLPHAGRLALPGTRAGVRALCLVPGETTYIDLRAADGPR